MYCQFENIDLKSWVSYQHRKLATNIRFSVRKYLVSPGPFDRNTSGQNGPVLTLLKDVSRQEWPTETSVRDDEIHKDV